VWFVFLGWFLLQAAQAEVGFAAAKQALEDVMVGDLMTRNPVTVPPEMSIEEFIETIVRRHGHSTYPVVRDGRLHGMISLRVAGAIPYEERSTQTVQQVMVPADEVPVLGPRQQVLDVLDALRSGTGRAVVVDFGQVVGLVSISDIAKALEFEKVRRPIRAQARPAGALVWVVVWLLIALALAAFYRPPLAVLAPGPAIDIAEDISIKGVPTEKPNGKYLLVAVQITQPTGLGVLYAMIHPDRDIIPRSALIPEGVSEEEEGRRQRAIFDESQTLAAAAAAQAAGHEVKIAGRGARIIQIATGAPAQGKLQPGDVITRVNDVEIQLASDLRRTITSLPSGTNFVLTVDRGGRDIQVEVSSARLSGAGGQAAIGVIVDTRDLDIDLPFEVEFDERNIGGPSAGLTYALAIADLINDEDLLRGRTIAASGTIQIDGEVGPVGGLNQKLEAAENADAQIFLVPVEEVRLVQNPDLSVRGVDTLRDALAVLRGA
jgi:PDZ domain-containing protein